MPDLNDDDFTVEMWINRPGSVVLTLPNGVSQHVFGVGGGNPYTLPTQPWPDEMRCYIALLNVRKWLHDHPVVTRLMFPSKLRKDIEDILNP